MKRLLPSSRYKLITLANIFLIFVLTYLYHSSSADTKIIISTMADQKSTETALHNLFKNPSAILCSSAAAAAAGDGQGQDEREAFLLASLDQISAPLAARMLAQAGLDGRSTTEPFALLDNGCGLGVVAPLLQRTIRPDVLRASTVVCGDYAEKLVEIVQRRIAREGWVSTEARVIDAQVSMSEAWTLVVNAM